MSTIEHSKLSEGVAVDIARVERLGDYTLRLSFSDGTSRELDFEPFLRGAAHPEIRAYLDTGKFGGFTLKDGELFWGDYELCFPIADLYEGRI